MNGRSFMDGLSLEEKERERKRRKKEEERGRERERERKREEGLEWELNPPWAPRWQRFIRDPTGLEKLEIGMNDTSFI